MNLVRLKNAQFADEANLNNTSYRIHPDGAFYVPPDVADQLCGDGRSGFYRAPDHRAAPGTVSEEQVVSMIAGLEPSPFKEALHEALNELRMKVTVDSPATSRPLSDGTHCGHSRPRSWTPQLGGKCAYEHHLREDRSPRHSRHSIGSAKRLHRHSPSSRYRDDLQLAYRLWKRCHARRSRGGWRWSGQRGCRAPLAGKPDTCPSATRRGGNSRRRRRRGSWRGGGSRSLLGDPGLAQAFENALGLDQIRRMVAARRPGGTDAGDAIGRIERKTCLDRGLRLVQPTKLRQGGG